MVSDAPSATPRIEHIPPDGGQHLAVHFETQTVKVGTEQSAGELLFMATTTAPGKGTPLHTHPVHEYFYILDGTYEFRALHEGVAETFRAAAGSVVHVPPDVPHQYTNVTEKTGQMLTLFTPATSMQRFFEAVHVLGTRENEPLIPGTPEYLAASGELGRAHGLRRVELPSA